MKSSQQLGVGGDFRIGRFEIDGASAESHFAAFRIDLKTRNFPALDVLPEKGHLIRKLKPSPRQKPSSVQMRLVASKCYGPAHA